MISFHRIERGVLVACLIALLISAYFLACTQKNPMDPTRSLQENVTLLVQMSAAPTQIAVGGGRADIRVRLVDEDGNPIAEAVIRFSTDLGTVTESSLTGTDGWAEAVLTSGAASGTATVTAKYAEFTILSTSVTFVSPTQARLQMTIGENSLLANGLEATQVSATVFADSAKPMPGAAVTFLTTLGSITPTVITDALGVARATLVSVPSLTDAAATVTAVYDSLFVADVVFFRGVQFSVTADPTAIVADGQSRSTLTALLKETTTQVAISDARVSFSSDLGLIPNAGTTDAQGIAQVALTSGVVTGTAHVVAYYGGLRADTVDVQFLSSSESVFALSNFNVGSSAVLASGIHTTDVSVRVVDEDGDFVQGDSVRFVTDTGAFDDEWVVTDVGGYASSTLTPRASGTDSMATVTVSRGNGSQSVSSTVTFVGITLELGASPLSILADGSSTSTVRAHLKRTTSQVAVSGGEIAFGTDLGTITNLGTTAGNGVVEVALTSGTTTGIAHVTATYGNTITDTVEVAFVSETLSEYILSAIAVSEETALASGVDRITVSARVTDGQANPVLGVVVTFSATAGSIGAQAVTDETGWASVDLTSVASATDVGSTITARLDDQTLTTDVTFLGIEMEMDASPASIIADGKSTSNVVVVLKQATSKIAVDGVPVYFSTDLGTIPNQTSTDASGVAAVALTSGTATGTATVVARYGNTLADTATVDFQPSVPTYLDVSTSPPVIPADGQTGSTVTAIVSDATHSPVPDGIPVLFSIIEGTGTMSSQQTTQGGTASSILTSTVPGMIRIRISVGALADTATVVCTVGEVNQILVTADKDSMDADGIETATITASVMDGQGNPVSGVTVQFSATLGDITPMAPTDGDGIARAQYSSSQVGTATITATVGNVSGIKIIKLLPGGPTSIVLRFDPTSIGVKGTGQVQTAIVEAEVRDSKNNPVVDGTMVRFSILAGPGGGETLSTADPIPTVGGIARVSLSSGTVSGNVRVQAEVVDGAVTVIAIASEILIHAGEPYMEDVNDLSTTHLTVAANRLNIWATLDTTQISIMVVDKYNNPVQEGTAVYMTTSGGGINTHTAYTDAYGKASVILTAGNPQPTIDRFYNYFGMQDPNLGTVIPGYTYYPVLDELLLPNYDAFPELGFYPGIVDGRVLNTEGDTRENDGIARVIAYTEGQDATGDSVRAWDWLAVVYSGSIATFEDNSADVFPGTLAPGESVTYRICIMDGKGNPIASGSTIRASIVQEDVQAGLSWEEITTDRGQGTSYYYLTLSNAINPEDPKPGFASVKISVESINGEGSIVSQSIYISD